MPGRPLVGRETELEAVGGALEAVVAGAGRLVLVRGQAGIGKTRLLEASRERAAALRIVVIEGRATELESDIPLAAVVDALEARLADVPDARLRDLGDERLDQLGAVIPGLRRRPASSWASGSPGERWQLYRALRDLIDVLATTRPVALLLDDIHWADPATLEFVEHLMRRPPRSPHLIFLSLRPGDAAERLAAAQRGASVDSSVFIDLAPLDRGPANLLMERVDDPLERERLYRESGGNPLLLAELVRLGATGEVPRGIVAAVRAEVNDLPAAARGLLEGGAIAGDPFEVELARVVAGLAEREAFDALDVLCKRELVQPTEHPRRFAFRHPVIRSAVYAAIPVGAQLRGHGAAAEELARAGAALPARARHLAHAATPGDMKAAAVLRAAAGVVRAQAPAIAADWLTAARRADPSVGAEGLAELAEVLVDAGRLQAALEIVDEAAAITNGNDGDLAVRIAVAGASVERLLGRHVPAQRRLERALAAAPEDGRLAAQLAANLALSAYVRGDAAEMARWADQARREAVADPLVRSSAAALFAVSHAYAGRMDAAHAEMDAALAAADSGSDEQLAAVAELMMAVAWGAVALERLDAGLALGRRAGTAARRAGNGVAAVPLDLAAVVALGLLGRLAEALDAADDAEHRARMTRNDQTAQWALWMRAWVLLEAGRLDEALPLAEESAALAERLDDSALVTIAGAVLGAVLVATGDSDRGRSLLAAYDVEPGWICRWSPWLVEGDLAVGDSKAARAHVARASDIAAATDLPGARAAASRAGALLAIAEHHGQRAEELARAALADSQRIGAALDGARSRLLLGRALAQSDRDAAIAELMAAAQDAATAGGDRVHDEAVRQLRRLGRRVGRGGARASGEGYASLSAREHEIAELVAAGSTNREIAARLYLSEKTVERHMSHIFSKLGVRRRAEVAAQVTAAHKPAA
ncbi:MAG: AAA family ATPase [Thermoleophilaceae bacterium]